MDEMTLGELCSLIVDTEHKTAPKDPAGSHPLIRTSDLGKACADLSRVQRVNSETHALWTKRAVPIAGDLILARESRMASNPSLDSEQSFLGPIPAGLTVGS
jgi:type I restriction enzyme S subunit